MMRLHVGDDVRQRAHVMDKRPPASPIEVAGDALADELAPARARQRSDMGVGQMGETKVHARQYANSRRRIKLRR